MQHPGIDESLSLPIFNDKDFNDGDESDDDSLLDFVSPEEEQRKEEMLEKIRMKKNLEEAGYSLHLADSVSHLDSVLIALAQQKEAFSDRLVIHFCDTNSTYCARLDLELEKLAKTYIGTRFRRLYVGARDTVPWLERQLQSMRRRGLHPPSAGQAGGGLLCCWDGSATHWVPQRFGDDQEVFVQDLLAHLHSCRALSSDAPSLGRRLIEDEEEAEEGGSFCDDPSCDKRFAHEHIGATKPSFLLDLQDQEGLLAPHHFTRL